VLERASKILTALLADSAASDGARTAMRRSSPAGSTASTVPTASTIPVNKARRPTRGSAAAQPDEVERSSSD